MQGVWMRDGEEGRMLKWEWKEREALYELVVPKASGSFSMYTGRVLYGNAHSEFCHVTTVSSLPTVDMSLFTYERKMTNDEQLVDRWVYVARDEKSGPAATHEWQLVSDVEGGWRPYKYKSKISSSRLSRVTTTTEWSIAYFVLSVRGDDWYKVPKACTKANLVQ